MRVLVTHFPRTNPVFGSARHRCATHVSPLHTLRPIASPPAAFVLDIDGVLLRGRHALPEATRALRILHGENCTKMKIPFVVLTNGGGSSEENRALRLSSQLAGNDAPSTIISPLQTIQAHTILKDVASKYEKSAVLVLGGQRDDVRDVALGYGFTQVYTPIDVMAWNPSVYPFYKLTPEDRSMAQPVDFSKTPISAIFVSHDPRNWGQDIQIMCDVIQSAGIIGGPYQRAPENPVDLVFCNPDLIWRNDFPRPRLGQGAFITAFQAVYKALTGSEYPYVQYGKPTAATLRFAESALINQVEMLYGHRELPPVYMIGDNPESDIAGANAIGWFSVLVRTGVYNPADGPPTHKPTYQAAHVEDAVLWAIARELQVLGKESEAI